MKTKSHEYFDPLKDAMRVQKITLVDIPGVDLDRDRLATAPNAKIIRSDVDWMKNDRMLKRIARGGELAKKPSDWAVNGSNQLWGNE